MTNYFRNFLGDGVEAPSTLKVEEARQWYREKANEIDRLDSNFVIRKATDLQTSLKRLGHFYLFKYDPKAKETLPYYDRFPVILLLNKDNVGFTGLNLHYLPFQFRAALMDQLYDFQTGKDEMARIRMTYTILNNTKRLRFFRPCLKQYLNSHMRSKLVHIDVSEWDTSLFLPLQSFAKKKEQYVHRDSVRMIRNYR